MDINNLAALICRGIGLLLFLFGGTYLLAPLIFGMRALYFPPPESGWTSYAPINSVSLTILFIRAYLPALAQVVLGLCLLLFSRPFGRWLAVHLTFTA